MITADTRVRYCNEILQGMKVVKAAAWEAPIFGEVQKKRDDELKTLYDLAIFR